MAEIFNFSTIEEKMVGLFMLNRDIGIGNPIFCFEQNHAKNWLKQEGVSYNDFHNLIIPGNWFLWEELL